MSKRRGKMYLLLLAGGIMGVLGASNLDRGWRMLDQLWLHWKHYQYLRGVEREVSRLLEGKGIQLVKDGRVVLQAIQNDSLVLVGIAPAFPYYPPYRQVPFASSYVERMRDFDGKDAAFYYLVGGFDRLGEEERSFFPENPCIVLYEGGEEKERFEVTAYVCPIR